MDAIGVPQLLSPICCELLTILGMDPHDPHFAQAYHTALSFVKPPTWLPDDVMVKILN